MTFSSRHSSIQGDTDTALAGLPSTLRQDIVSTSNQPHENAPDVNALLPARLANLVSFATRSTGYAVRITSAIGGYGLDVAKHTTLSTLQLGRTVVEGALNGARKDAVVHSASRRPEAETTAEVGRTIDRLNTGMDQLIFWAATGFNFTSAALSMLSETSQLLLSTLDQFFGSTDSSRAIASIITMIRREIAKPAGGKGEAVSVGELVTAFCALAYLQRSCKALLEEERRTLGVDEIVWDVVVLNSGVRVDVQEESPHRQIATHASTEEGLPAPQLEQWIMKALPDKTEVSITREIVTCETIRVDAVGDADHFRLEAPPGVELIEENRDICPARAGMEATTARTRFVFRHESRQEKRMSFGKAEDDFIPLTGHVEWPDHSSQRNSVENDRGVSDGQLHGHDAVKNRGQLRPPSMTFTPPSAPDLTADNLTQGPSRAIDSLRSSPPSSPRGVLFQTALSGSPSSATSVERSSSSTDQGKMSGFRNALRKSMSVFNNQRTDSQKFQMTPTHESLQNSYFSIHETMQQSTISLAETYSIPADDDYRPASASEEQTLSPDSQDINDEISYVHEVPARNHRRTKSQTTSIYTLKTSRSQTSLVSYVHHHRSAFSPAENLNALRRDGSMPGMFPERHLLANAARYMRFASASYGSNFLKIMGIASSMPRPGLSDDTHHELRAFAHHTRSHPSSILLSSFVDPQGGSDATGSTNTGVPLVHYVSLDHESKAVVLACRGTLGFEDVLTDMTCDYDDLIWRGEAYQVHKGVHASAKRLLYGGDGRILYTLRAALEEFPTYGLVLTGHSLGAAVTSLLGIMLSEPGRGTGTPFVTSAEPHTNLLAYYTSTTGNPPPSHICLPPNRAIHVYAYGPLATVSPSLRLATRGLITTIVNGNDLVPHLSLGLLHDFQAAALALKTDHASAKAELIRRLWHSLSNAPRRAGWGGSFPSSSSFFSPPSWARQESGEGEDAPDADWAFDTLNLLREVMTAGEKLVPPGEVFVLESTPVLRREAFVFKRGGDDDSTKAGGKWAWEAEENHFGRPARRLVFKYVRDVERRFGEVRFGRGMLTDHSPGRYEAALERLSAGVGVRG